jgi:hypothetical protein
MAAFNYSVTQQIYNNIRALYFRRCQVGKMLLTHDEFLQLFVPATDRELYKAIAPLAHVEYHMRAPFVFDAPGHGTLKGMVVSRDVPGSFAPPIPRHPVIQPDAPEELRERFFSWINNGPDVSRDYGRVYKVFQELNENCSKHTMRYYWPTIIAICAENEMTKRYAAELQELKMPLSPKPLPAGLFQACKKSAETISTVQLLDPSNFSAPDLQKQPLTIEIVAGQEYKEPVGRFFGMQ